MIYRFLFGDSNVNGKLEKEELFFYHRRRFRFIYQPTSARAEKDSPTISAEGMFLLSYAYVFNLDFRESLELLSSIHLYH